MAMTFPLDDFLMRFPEFDNETTYPRATVENCGQRAMMHITPDAEGMPLNGHYREYGLFLMTAHLITLDAQGDDGSTAGTPYKSTIGSVSIETTKQNTFMTDDWNYWLNLTKYGRELLAYLELQSAGGIFLNDENDSVRDLV